MEKNKMLHFVIIYLCDKQLWEKKDTDVAFKVLPSTKHLTDS